MNGLDLIRATLAEWRKNRGNETTFYKCQHFDGWYVQWALQGFRDDRSIRVYLTAQIAADASPIFTRHINDKAIQAGDRLYFRYGVPGHIVTAVGWDGDRLLVSNTANGGDTVIALTNNVKIHHADTIDLPFIGASRQNGSNRGIRVENYIHGAGIPAGNPQPAGDTRQWIDLTNWYWYTNPTDAQAKRSFRKPLLEGRYPVIGRDANGAVQVLSNSLGRIWVHSSALGGAPAPAPAPAPAGGTRVRLGGERWYWYLNADDAGAMRNVQGKRRGQIMLEGDYPIIGRAANGAIQVLSNSMGRVWLHPSARSKVV